MVPATYLQSTNGTAFDGAVFGSQAVYFPQSATTAFAGTTISAPSGVQTLLVTGLTPGASYGVTILPNGSGYVVTVTPGGVGAISDAAGVLNITL
jgi:hypothetical protein